MLDLGRAPKFAETTSGAVHPVIRSRTGLRPRPRQGADEANTAKILRARAPAPPQAWRPGSFRTVCNNFAPREIGSKIAGFERSQRRDCSVQEAPDTASLFLVLDEVEVGLQVSISGVKPGPCRLPVARCAHRVVVDQPQTFLRLVPGENAPPFGFELARLFDGEALLEVLDGDFVVVTAEIQFQKVRQCGGFTAPRSGGLILASVHYRDTDNICVPIMHWAPRPPR